MTDDTKMLCFLLGSLAASLVLIFGAGWFAASGIVWAAILSALFGVSSVVFIVLFTILVFG